MDPETPAAPEAVQTHQCLPVAKKLLEALDANNDSAALLAAQEIVATLNQKLNISTPGLKTEEELQHARGLSRRDSINSRMPKARKSEVANGEPPKYEGVL